MDVARRAFDVARRTQVPASCHCQSCRCTPGVSRWGAIDLSRQILDHLPHGQEQSLVIWSRGALEPNRRLVVVETDRNRDCWLVREVEGSGGPNIRQGPASASDSYWMSCWSFSTAVADSVGVTNASSRCSMNAFRTASAMMRRAWRERKSLTMTSAWKGVATSSVNDKSATDQRVGRAYIEILRDRFASRGPKRAP